MENSIKSYNNGLGYKILTIYNISLLNQEEIINEAEVSQDFNWYVSKTEELIGKEYEIVKVEYVSEHTDKDTEQHASQIPPGKYKRYYIIVSDLDNQYYINDISIPISQEAD